MRLFKLPETAAIEAVLAAYDLLYLSGITLSLFDEDGLERAVRNADRLRHAAGR
ncbi:MAG: hypothetical protein U1E38_06085 [Rhodospirillales bacterium]